MSASLIMHYFVYFVLCISIINILRLMVMMVGSDIYEVKKQLKLRQQRRQLNSGQRPYRPYISVIIPAHNEELCIIRTVKSVLANDYAYKQIIVVDDGSKDKTLGKLRYFKKKHQLSKLVIVHQKQQGKAEAINNALRNHVRASLVMVLDADSILHPEALTRMVRHFEDPLVGAAASNVKVIDSPRLLTLAQRLEYVVSYRMKRALTTMNMEYIIGGVGSTFRRSIVRQVGFFDNDTMTEDIEFTMKVIAQKGNRQHKVTFAADVLAYTEAVLTFGALLRQRFRWKYGRMQTFVKNRQIFFSRDKKHTKRLTWVNLPFVVFSEGLLLLDPLLSGFVLFAAIRFGGVISLLNIYVVVTLFCLLNVLGESTESLRSKAKLIMLVPFAYPLLLIMSSVDFFVLVKSLVKFPAILRGNSGNSIWQPVARSGSAANLHNNQLGIS